MRIAKEVRVGWVCEEEKGALGVVGVAEAVVFAGSTYAVSAAVHVICIAGAYRLWMCHLLYSEQQQPSELAWQFTHNVEEPTKDLALYSDRKSMSWVSRRDPRSLSAHPPTEPCSFDTAEWLLEVRRGLC